MDQNGYNKNKPVAFAFRGLNLIWSEMLHCMLLFSGRTVYVCTYSCQARFCRPRILWKVLWQTVINETPAQVSTTAGPDGVYWLQSFRINCDPSAPSHLAGDPSCTFHCAQSWCHLHILVLDFSPACWHITLHALGQKWDYFPLYNLEEQSIVCLCPGYCPQTSQINLPCIFWSAF